MLFIGSMACQPDDTVSTDTATKGNNAADTMRNQLPGGSLRIRIGSRTFSATLFNNSTGMAVKTRLPMTVPMQELNGNEKFAQLSAALPTDASKSGMIQTGDLMLYGSTTLVLFYQSFPTPYSYTTIGRVTNPADLAAALGRGNTTVTFDLE